MNNLLDFLNRLEQNKIYYRMNKVRNGIMVEITVPGERWEVEYMEDGYIEVEKFVSDGRIFHQDEIEVLFQRYSD